MSKVLCIVDMYMDKDLKNKSLSESILFGTLHDKRRFIMGKEYQYNEGQSENEQGEPHSISRKGHPFFDKHFIEIEDDNN